MTSPWPTCLDNLLLVAADRGWTLAEIEEAKKWAYDDQERAAVCYAALAADIRKRRALGFATYERIKASLRADA